MNFFKGRSKSFNISESDPTFKVKYIGNVLTTFVKGEGCVDRPLSILWNNYLTNPSAPKEMQLTVTNSGLKGVTKEQGLMEYRCHRIAYSFHHPQFPKLFVWVYRHEGRKMKVEVRCHAVLCKTEAKAKAIYIQLKERLASALSEFTREKTRRQNCRLNFQRTNSMPSMPYGLFGASVLPRTQFLLVGRHFKPPASLSTAAPSLSVISEEFGEPDTIASGSSWLSWQTRSPKEDKWTEEEEEEEEVGSEMAEDDDSVFLFPPPPDSTDSSLTDFMPSYFLNSEVPEIYSRSEFDGFTSVSSLPELNKKCTDMFSFPRALWTREMESDKEFNVHLDQNDTEGIVATAESDNQSVESGFSEQDAHDL